MTIRRILLEINGSFGLGDYLCMDPMLQALQIKHGGQAEFYSTTSAGNLYFRSDFNVISDIRNHTFDQTLFILGYKELGPISYQKLESMESLIAHMASYANVDVTGLRPRLHLTERDFEPANRILPKLEKGFIACCTDFSDARRHLPLTTWEQLLPDLARLGFRIVLVGQNSFRKQIGVVRWMKIKKYISYDTQKTLTVRETAALISRCEAFIGNNSGLFHYAQAADTPCLVTMSVNSPQRFIHPNGPPVEYVISDELPCIRCTDRSLAFIVQHGCVTTPKGRCMKDITAKRLMDAFRNLIERIGVVHVKNI